MVRYCLGLQEVFAEEAAEGDAFVAVTMSDTGIGIPKDRIERIFTTKAVGKGTGLGLYAVEDLSRILRKSTGGAREDRGTAQAP